MKILDYLIWSAIILGLGYIATKSFFPVWIPAGSVSILDIISFAFIPFSCILYATKLNSKEADRENKLRLFYSIIFLAGMLCAFWGYTKIASEGQNIILFLLVGGLAGILAEFYSVLQAVMGALSGASYCWVMGTIFSHDWKVTLPVSLFFFLLLILLYVIICEIKSESRSQ